MLELIGLHDDLVARTCREILECGSGSDLSAAAVVFPNKRFGFFLRQELSREIKGNFFPPAMFPVEALFLSLFQLNTPGFKVAAELEAAHAVYESAAAVFPGGMYGSRQIADFPAFLPWARKILSALEEILTEDGRLEGIQWEEYREFTGLGDYHKHYKTFIQNIPALLDDFQYRLRLRRQATMGMVYREVAALAESGMLETPAAENWIFSGFNALNACERKLFHFFFKERRARLILRTDPQALGDPRSPVHLQAGTIDTLGLETPPLGFSSRTWNDLAGRVILYPCDGVESEVFQAFRILQEICRGRDETALKKVAVLLPSPPTLIPFVQGAVSRFDQENDPVPFNITLGYPLERTPMMQLVDSLLTVLENRGDDGIAAGDYLQLIRHPYVKVSGDNNRLEPLKRGIHLLEDIINGQNLTRFTVEGLKTKFISEIERPGNNIDPDLATEITAQVDSLHRRFIADDIADFPSLLAFLRLALESVGSAGNCKAHLFLNEYAAAALQALEELEEFARDRRETLGAARMADMAALVRAHFRGRTIRFEGSPLKGIQVMGPLEFRGLSFDEVVILDALEGILPGTAKYDPILPADIRSIFKIRDHGDWEKIYAFNFFSLLGAAGRVHILYPSKDEGDRDCERSRFIERIAYEIEKRTGRTPETRRAALPFSIPSRKLKRVSKSKAIQDKLEALTLSPSSLEAYVNCPLQFYFSRILGLKEREDLTVETEGSLIGTIVHETLRVFYKKYPGAGPMAAAGPEILAGDLEKFLFAAFRAFNFEPEKGLERIRSWTLMEQLRKFIEADQRRMEENGIQVQMFEKELSGVIPVPWRPQPVPIRGRIDRCEVEGGLLRIIDYKTGNFRLSPDNMRKVSFAGGSLASASESDYLQSLNGFHKKYQGMQLLIYLLLLAQKESKAWAELDGAFVLLRERGDFFRFLFAPGKKKDEMDPGEKAGIMEAFRTDLQEILRDIYSREYFLANTADERHCSYCPFRLPCGNL